MNGCLFGSCYAAHHDQRLDFLKEVLVCVGTQSSLTPFHLVGDWNDEPHEAPLAMALEGAGARVVATEQPTRWGGKRCLDYMITNVPAEPGIEEIQHSTQAYSDHKLMICSCQIRGEPRTRWRLQATAQYAIPENCSKDKWHHEVTQAWRKKESNYQPVREAHELSAQYQQLCRDVESALATAAPLCNSDGKKPRGARPKGSAARFEEIPEMPAKADPIDESFETRVIRNALGQLKELAALEVSDHQPRVKRDAAEKLREKLLRTRKVDLERPRYLEITRLERVLQSVRKKKLDERMQRWKNRMRENPSHVFRWLDGKQGPPIHNIYDECDDDATQNIAEVLETLACHWRKVWKRPSPELSDLRETLQRTLGPAREIQKWSAVSGAELEKEAKKQTGTAASVDGWSGDEVASFPLVIWDRIAMFFRNCERLGSAPEQFGFARQAHIPKEGKGVREHDGALHAAAMRPITILTALWRVWGRARLRNSKTAMWLETWMTPEICGGRRKVDALSSVIKILEAASNGKYVATFDYSLAFDFTNPAMAVEILRWLGMPAGTAGLLKSVWQSQKRTLQYAGESLKTAEPVMTSLPQGDPWSMIAMAAVLLIPLCDLREAIPNTDILLYVDDRSWASQSAQDCVKFGKKWKT